MFGDWQLDKLHPHVERSSARALSESALQRLSECKGHSDFEMGGNRRLTRISAAGVKAFRADRSALLRHAASFAK